MPNERTERSCRVTTLVLLACGALTMAWPGVSIAGGKDDALFARDYINYSHPAGTQITKQYKLVQYQRGAIWDEFECTVTRTTEYSDDGNRKVMTSNNAWSGENPRCSASWEDETIYVPREGLYWTTFGQRSFDPPLLVMPHKFYLGDTWGGSSTLTVEFGAPFGLHIETRTALGLEDLTILDDNGGERSFSKCLKARHDRISQGAGAPGMTRVRWYCPDMGWVKEDRIQAYHGHDPVLSISRSEVQMP